MPAAARRNANRARVTGAAPKELATPTQRAREFAAEKNRRHARGLCTIDGCPNTVEIHDDGFGGVLVEMLCKEHR